MNTYTKIILILALIIMLIVVSFGFLKIQEIIFDKKLSSGPFFCHYCKMAYTSKGCEDYIYCPCCGKKLRTIDDDPTEEPFEEFKNKQDLSDEDLLKLKNLRHNNSKKD